MKHSPKALRLSPLTFISSASRAVLFTFAGFIALSGCNGEGTKKSASGLDSNAMPAGNMPPVASAGGPQTAFEGDSVTLTAAASGDADGQITSYQWKQIDSATAVVFDSTSASEVSFNAPATEGTTILTFEVMVTDNDGATDTSIVAVTVLDKNRPPVAVASGPTTVDALSTVTLIGGESSDDSGVAPAYQWSQVDGVTVTLTNDETATATFTAPDVTQTITLIFRLLVTDADGATDRDYVYVAINPVVASLEAIDLPIFEVGTTAQPQALDINSTWADWQFKLKNAAGEYIVGGPASTSEVQVTVAGSANGALTGTTQVVAHSGVATFSGLGYEANEADLQVTATVVDSSISVVVLITAYSAPALSVSANTTNPNNKVMVDWTGLPSDKAGWLVIYDQATVSGNIQSDKMLGHTAVTAGYNSSTVITLSRDVMNGETLYAKLHKDLGTVDTFEWNGTDVTTDEVWMDNSNAVAATFTVTWENGIKVMGQEFTISDKKSVTVATVVLAADGFVVVHEDDSTNPGTMGVMVGSKFFAAGSYTDQTFMLSRDVVAGETLHFMLHADTDADGNFTAGTDVALTDAADGTFIVPVTTTILPALAVLGQTSTITNPDTLVVASAYSNVDSWIVVHDAGASFAVLATMALPKESELINTSIVLNPAPASGATPTLIVMLHTDNDTTDGAFNATVDTAISMGVNTQTITFTVP